MSRLRPYWGIASTPKEKPRFCLGGWDGCREIYTGGHRCEKDDGHEGRCVCVCGATTIEEPPKWPK